MVERHASWYSGPAHGLVWPHGLALVDASVAPAAADAVWRLAPTTIGDFIEVLRDATGDSLTSLPGFAVAFGGDREWRVGVRGGLRVALARTDDVVVVADDGPRWAERHVDGVERVGLSLRADAVATGAVGRPIVAGVVPAIALLRAVTVEPFRSDAPQASQRQDRPHSPAAPAETTGATAIPGSFAHLWGDTQLSGAPAPPPSAAARLGDHDDLTILGPSTEAPPPAMVVRGPAEGRVLARQCAQGHANPPDRTACRTCGGVLTGPPTQVPQPALGRAVLASGRVIELTGPVILGREPQANRVTDGPLPQLVALARNHISRNQVRLLPQGWQVLAVDLHSKNGTLLLRRGEPPVRLPERPVPLRSGDVLDFGHGVLLTLEDLP